MSETKSTKARIDDSVDEGSTAELPTLKLSDVVECVETPDAEGGPTSAAAGCVAEMESEIEDLKSRWQDVDAALSQSEQRAVELDQALAERDAEIDRLEAELHDARQDNDRLGNSLAQLEHRDEERDETLRELNRSLQSQTSLSEMLRADLGKRDAELQAAKAELAATGSRIQSKERNLELRERKISELESHIADQDRQIAELRDQQVEMQEEIQQLQGDIKLKQSMIDAFDRSARRLTDLNQSLKRRAGTDHPDEALIIEAAHIFEHAGASADGDSKPGTFPVVPEGVQHMMVQGTGEARRFFPLTDAEMTIGRARTCDICIPDETISRVHARLVMTEQGPEIVDAGSTNGILVNNAEVTSASLKHGDIVSLAGTLKLTYVEVQPPNGSD